jgi:suppressor of tumorigenicity protein 13
LYIKSETVLSYIRSLESKLGSEHGPNTSTAEMETEEKVNIETNMDVSDEEPFPPIYVTEGGMEDYDMASNYKQEASDLLADGNINGALEKYTAAILAAPPSALLYANRATALYKLQRYRAAERDCNEALKENPDSAKALRTRGKVRKELMMWEEALSDLSTSQQIDYDESTVEDLKFLTEKRLEHEKMIASERIQHEERLRKKAEEIKKAREEAMREAEDEAKSAQRSSYMPAAGMPGGGMGGMPGGGMPGMEGMMGALLSDPELVAAMQNPKVQAAFQELMSGPGGPMGLMSNPAKLQEMMSDPEVGPVMQKLMAKLGAGAMGGMGTGATMPPTDNDDDEDGIPNLDDLNGDVDLDQL